MFEESAIRKVVDYLHDNKIDEFVKLPQIAVMGDTSSGKSSLLSAISNIQFPASDQLTTRCPTRLHMERSKNQRYFAKIEVQWHHSSSYKDQGRYESPLLEGKESFVKIPDYITEAQEYIIKLSQQEVAFDVINVKIGTPDGFDLTLTDLPGFVRSVGRGESTRIVEDIQALNQEYLNNERCIILAIFPANVDFHNSQIMADALKVDPETKRTIPVITKPDLIDEGAEKGVLELLHGSKTQDFALGFHIVKCRGQKALKNGLTVEQGLRDEEVFFRNVEPWRSCFDREQFGVMNLKKKLAALQIEMLKQNVPMIVKEINAKKAKAVEDLTKLGSDLSTDVQRREVFSGMEQAFKVSMKHNIDGTKYAIWRGELDYPLRGLIEQEHGYFKDKILQSRLNNMDSQPRVGDRVRVKTAQGDIIGTVYHVHDENQLFVHPENETHFEKFYKPIQNYSLNSLSSLPWVEGSKVHLNDASNTPCKILKILGGEKFNYLQYLPLTLEEVEVDHSHWILSELLKLRSHQLPVFLSSEVFTSITGHLISTEWKKFATELTRNVFTILERCLQDTLSSTVVGTTLELQRWFAITLEKIVADIKRRTMDQVFMILDDEANQPYTQNHYLFETISKKRLSKLTLTLKRMATDGKLDLKEVLGLLKANEELSCEDHIAREMELILCAYGKVAAKRVIDQIPMTIEREYLQSLLKEMDDNFKRTDDQLSILLRESSVLSANRKKLNDMIFIFTEAENNIERFLGFH
eukprot:gene15369-17195_t